MRYLTLLFFLLSSHLALGAVVVSSDCDANGKTLKEYPSPAGEACAKDCDAMPECGGFTFVSHWNHCALKKNVTRTNPVKMTSGEFVTKDGKRTLASESANADHKGKDWRKFVLKTASECRDQCQNHVACIGFTFIGGYDICWLKNTAGKIVPKTFYCGKKS
jgi:hypothetical protein